MKIVHEVIYVQENVVGDSKFHQNKQEAKQSDSN